MDKIFDHSRPRKGWVIVEDPAAYIKERWDEERDCDRDQGTEYVIEHWNSDTRKIVFHVLSVTGWYYGEPPQAEDYVEDNLNGWDREPTTLSPERDYLLVSRFASSKWPPTHA